MGAGAGGKSYAQVTRAAWESYAQGQKLCTGYAASKSYPQVSQVLAARESYPQVARGQVGGKSYPQVSQVGGLRGCRRPGAGYAG